MFMFSVLRIDISARLPRSLYKSDRFGSAALSTPAAGADIFRGTSSTLDRSSYTETCKELDGDQH